LYKKFRTVGLDQEDAADELADIDAEIKQNYKKILGLLNL
jgi:hypothetical protein